MIVAEAPPFSFLHCADLHLDSPFRGIEEVAPAVAAVLRRASFQALDHLVQRALDTGVDFVIFAGDVYDGADRSLRAQLRLRESLERLTRGGVECFLAHGNHDPLPSWQRGLELPEGVHRFTSEVSSFQVERRGRMVAQIHGISYRRRDETESLLPLFPNRPGPPFAIGVLHANVGGLKGHDNYAPCTLEELRAMGFDYWALGHVHHRQVLERGNPWVVYPGFLQGRSVREPGPGGCYRVEVDRQGTARLYFERLDAVTWVQEQIDTSDIDSTDRLLDLALERREALRRTAVRKTGAERLTLRPAVLRLRLTGRSPLHGSLVRGDLPAQLLEALRDGEEERPDFVWTESLELQTRPPVDRSARRQQEDFLGELLRAGHRLREREDAAAEIRRRLGQRPEARLVEDALDQLDDEEILALLDDAEALALDHLEP
jgi:DNA repair exonuclease SbcCD nuclease subunit